MIEMEGKPYCESMFMLLPCPLLVEILEYCDTQSLGRLSQTCSQLRNFIHSEAKIWKIRSQKYLVTNLLHESFLKKSFSLGPKERCKIGSNWLKCTPQQRFVLKTRRKNVKIIPWLQLEKFRLYYSNDNRVEFVERCNPGYFKFRNRNPHLGGHLEDVVRFVCNEKYVISGGRDGYVCIWDKNTNILLFRTPLYHQSDVNTVACSDDVLVSGSRDCTVKVWSSLPYPSCKYTIDTLDKVWHVTASCDGRFIAAGTGSSNQAHPLRIYDLETGAKISSLGTNKFRAGDGIYHIFPESQNELYTGSYDSIIHLWDIRCPDKWVKKWDEPNDCAVYCIDSDKSFSFVCGTSRHGIVRLWDKRASKDIRVFYMGKKEVKTPVYSVSFDAHILCASLDDCICFCDFS